MWASAHAQKINIPVSMVTVAYTPIFIIFEVPDNGGPDNTDIIMCWLHYDQPVVYRKVYEVAF